MKLDLTRIREISKAIAAASIGAIGGTGTAFIVIPSDVAMPWYGYVIAGLANAVLLGLTVYLAPANRVSEPSPK